MVEAASTSGTASVRTSEYPRVQGPRSVHFLDRRSLFGFSKTGYRSRHLKRDDLEHVVGRAVDAAGDKPISGLDLLAASLEPGGSGARLVTTLGADPIAITREANLAKAGSGGPGFTEGAKRALEAVASKAIAEERVGSSRDMLLAVALLDDTARSLLERNGVNVDRLGLP